MGIQVRSLATMATWSELSRVLGVYIGAAMKAHPGTLDVDIEACLVCAGDQVLRLHDERVQRHRFIGHDLLLGGECFEQLEEGVSLVVQRNLDDLGLGFALTELCQ